MTRPSSRSKTDNSPWDWETVRREQLRAALRMTPAERLRWLEDAMEAARSLLGLARPQASTKAGD